MADHSPKLETPAQQPLEAPARVAALGLGLSYAANSAARAQQALITQQLATGSAATLQRAIAQSPRMTPPSRPGAKAPVPRTENHTGLPDQLKAGIESLSGHSLDDVRVHYNSAQPAQLQAHAYAQGSTIHLAPGQEQHLPHEAWHVVQQKQGRVKPTVQLEGQVAVNDDAGLEKEADVMGARAATATPVAPASRREIRPSPAAPLQRQKKSFDTTPARPELKVTHKAAVEGTVAEIERRVDQARGVSLNWDALRTDGRAYVSQWATTAKQYFDAPGTPPDFLHARFGYSVETIACGDLPSSYQGLNIDFQVSTGNTRPDIVLSSPTDGVVAWIDITSKGSADHIMGKDGAGWKTKPFVYEVFYDALQLNEVLAGMQDPVYRAWGEYLGSKNQATFEEQQGVTTTLRNSLTKLQQDNDWQTGLGNATTKKADTKTHLETLGMDLGSSSLKATKGALAEADISDGPYGFNTGNVKTDRGPARRFIKDKAAPAIAERHSAINQNYLEHYQDIIADHDHVPFVQDFYTLLQRGENVPALMELGTAVSAGASQTDDLKEEYDELADLTADPRVRTLRQQIIALVQAVPQRAEFEPIRAWANHVVGLVRNAKRLRQAIELRQQFQGFLEAKYGAADSPSVTVPEAQHLHALAQPGPTDDLLTAARNYLHDNQLPVVMSTDDDEDHD